MILVVDDHEDIRAVVTRILKMQGYAATAVASGEDALEYLKSQIPPCVVLDFNMPGIDGLSVLSVIRADERLKTVPVVMFTAGDSSLQQKCLGAGANAFIQKGAGLAELSNVVSRFCDCGFCGRSAVLNNPPSVFEKPGN